MTIDRFLSDFEFLHSAVTESERPLDSSALDEVSDLVSSIDFDEKSAFMVAEEFLGGENYLSSRNITTFSDFCFGNFSPNLKTKLRFRLDPLKIFAIHALAKKLIPDSIEKFPFRLPADTQSQRRDSLMSTPLAKAFFYDLDHLRSAHSPALDITMRALSSPRSPLFFTQSRASSSCSHTEQESPLHHDFRTILQMSTDINSFQNIPDLLKNICLLLKNGSHNSVRIVYDGNTYTSEDFTECAMVLRQAISTNCEKNGSIEIFYEDGSPNKTEEDFLKIVESFTSIAISTLEIRKKMETQSRIDLRRQLSHSIHMIMMNHELSHEAQLEEIGKITNESIIFGLLEDGALQKVNKPINLRQELKNLEAILRTKAAQKGLTLNITALEQLPQLVEGDFNQIKEIITALTDNAFKSSKANGSIEISINVLEQADDSLRMEIIVSDDGMGISDKDVPNVFEPFGVTDTYISTRSRSGLTLTNAKKIAALLGGDLSLERNKLNEGSTFKATIPLKKPELDSVESSPKTSPETSLGVMNAPAIAPDTLKKSISVLITDDEPLAQKLTTALLKKSEFKSSAIAVNGKEALDKFQEPSFPFDCILMDYDMPIMSGLDAVKEIRRLEKERGTQNRLPIILFSAANRRDGMSLDDQSLFDGFLAKPVKQKDLETQILGCFKK